MWILKLIIVFQGVNSRNGTKYDKIYVVFEVYGRVFFNFNFVKTHPGNTLFFLFTITTRCNSMFIFILSLEIYLLLKIDITTLIYTLIL